MNALGRKQKKLTQNFMRCILLFCFALVFSLCKKYNVTQIELNMANPDLSAVLKYGSTVRIPIKLSVETQKQELPPVNATTTEPEYYYHKVSKKQTIFSIAKQYSITVNDLIRNNPEITNGLVVGQVLKVLVSTTESSNTVVDQKVEVNNSKLTVPDAFEKYKGKASKLISPVSF